MGSGTRSGLTATLHADSLIIHLRTGDTHTKELLARISACSMSAPVIIACVYSTKKSRVCNWL